MAGRRRTALGLAALLAVVVLAACGGGGDGPNSVEEDTHSFEYPEGWSELEAEFIAEAPNNTASVSVGPEETGVNLITVGSFEVPVEVNGENLEQFRDDITAGVEQLFTQADGSIDEGPIPITVGGIDGYRFEGTSTTPIVGRRRGPHAVDPGLRRQDGLLHQLPVRARPPGGDPGGLQQVVDSSVRPRLARPARALCQRGPELLRARGTSRGGLRAPAPRRSRGGEDLADEPVGAADADLLERVAAREGRRRARSATGRPRDRRGRVRPARRGACAARARAAGRRSPSGAPRPACGRAGSCAGRRACDPRVHVPPGQLALEACGSTTRRALLADGHVLDLDEALPADRL